MILRIDRARLEALFIRLELGALSQENLKFLEEFTIVMKPIASGLDHLQSSHRTFGVYLPTLFGIKRDFESIRSSQVLNYCEPLLNAVENGFFKRFGSVMDLNNVKSVPAYLATISNPKFKMNYIPTDILSHENVKKLVNILIKAAEDVRNEEKISENYTETNATSANSNDDNNDYGKRSVKFFTIFI